MTSRKRESGGAGSRLCRAARLRQREKAIEDFTAAIALTPKDAKLYCWRAQCYAGLNDVDREIADYETAYKIDPPTGARSLFHAYVTKGDYKKAAYWKKLSD